MINTLIRTYLQMCIIVDANDNIVYCFSMTSYLGVAGLFKGLNWRIVLIATTFFLVNKFKGIILPIAFPDAVADKKEDKKQK